MPATFTGAHRRVKYESKVKYKKGVNNAWIQIPPFWAGYILARYGVSPASVSIDMNQDGVLTITPIDSDGNSFEITQEPV